MVHCPPTQANGDVCKEFCGSTDDAEPSLPAGCEHLQRDVGARVAWGLLMEMVNQLWFEFEAPRPDLAEILAILEVTLRPQTLSSQASSYISCPISHTLDLGPQTLDPRPSTVDRRP